MYIKRSLLTVLTNLLLLALGPVFVRGTDGKNETKMPQFGYYNISSFPEPWLREALLPKEAGVCNMVLQGENIMVGVFLE